MEANSLRLNAPCFALSRRQHQLNMDALQAYLSANLRGFDWSTVTLQQFLHGQSNPVRALWMRR